MVKYIRYSLRRGGGALQENMYVVRFRHLILRQQKYNMRQRVASTAIVARQLCSVQLQLLPYLTLFCESILACRSLFSAWKSARHERCYQGLKWVGTHGNAVLRPAISVIWRSETSNSVFLVGMHVPRPER